MSPRRVAAPSGTEPAEPPILAASGKVDTQWDKLCRSHRTAMASCYQELAANPFPAWPSPRHHKLKGKRMTQGKGPFWEYEVGGGERVRYKKGPNGEVVVVYAGPSPPDTH